MIHLSSSLMIRPCVGCLAEGIAGEVEAGLPQCKFHFALVGRFSIQIDEAPEDSSAAVHVHPGRQLLDMQFRIQAGHQVLNRKELMFARTENAFGNSTFVCMIDLPTVLEMQLCSVTRKEKRDTGGVSWHEVACRAEDGSEARHGSPRPSPHMPIAARLNDVHTSTSGPFHSVAQAFEFLDDPISMVALDFNASLLDRSTGAQPPFQPGGKLRTGRFRPTAGRKRSSPPCLVCPWSLGLLGQPWTCSGRMARSCKRTRSEAGDIWGKGGLANCAVPS